MQVIFFNKLVHALAASPTLNSKNQITNSPIKAQILNIHYE